MGRKPKVMLHLVHMASDSGTGDLRMCTSLTKNILFNLVLLRNFYYTFTSPTVLIVIYLLLVFFLKSIFNLSLQKKKILFAMFLMFLYLASVLPSFVKRIVLHSIINGDT